MLLPWEVSAFQRFQWFRFVSQFLNSPQTLRSLREKFHPSPNYPNVIHPTIPIPNPSAISVTPWLRARKSPSWKMNLFSASFELVLSRRRTCSKFAGMRISLQGGQKLPQLLTSNSWLLPLLPSIPHSRMPDAYYSHISNFRRTIPALLSDCIS